MFIYRHVFANHKVRIYMLPTTPIIQHITRIDNKQISYWLTFIKHAMKCQQQIYYYALEPTTIYDEDLYTMSKLTKEQRSYIMSRNRGRDTNPEIILRKALWKKGIRYRKNYRKLPGTPDIALLRQRIAIFVDGDFWHARNHFEHPGEQILSNRKYWTKHLSRNVEHDREVNDALTQSGWLVLRFWESDIQKNLEKVIAEILEYV